MNYQQGRKLLYHACCCSGTQEFNSWQIWKQVGDNFYFLFLFFSNMKTGWWYHLVPGGLSLQHAHCAFVAIQSCIKIINEKYKHCIYTAYTAQVPRAYSGYIAFTAYTFYTVWQTVRLFQLLEQLLFIFLAKWSDLHLLTWNIDHFADKPKVENQIWICNLLPGAAQKNFQLVVR